MTESHPHPTLRLFLAVYPPPAAAAAMTGLLAGMSRARVRRMPADQIHMTILFLGDRAPDQVEKIIAEARSAAVGIGPVTLSPRKLITLPDGAPPRLIALEARTTPNLHTMYRRLTAGLADPEDNSIRPALLPHFTLCRFRRGTPAKPINTPAILPDFEITELKLMQSVRGLEGAEHTVVATIPLVAAPVARPVSAEQPAPIQQPAPPAAS